MIDRELFALLGPERKHIYAAVALKLAGMLANLGVTGSLCYALWLLMHGAGASAYVLPGVVAVLCVVARYVCTCRVSDVCDLLGRRVKKSLRASVYAKILSLGGESGSDLGMAGLTQVSLEGIEQLDLYYSQYLPQFFYALLAPVLLFATTVWIDWRVAVTLFVCVPLIPLSIVLVSKYAKRIFAKYWGRYTSMGDGFLDSVQGLKELKIFRADGAMHAKMERSAEEFRRVTMRVLSMQLMSTTVMDFIAYTGAGIGVGISLWGVAHQGLEPTAALFLILTAAEFFLPLRALGSAFHVAMNGASAGHKIIELLQTPARQWGEKSLVTDAEGPMLVDIKDLTFSYDKRRDVLKGVNMSFPARGLTAIVGESGCGKSTIVGLLQGLHQADHGEITFGGIAIGELSREELYRHLVIVSYDTYIFNQTVRENFEMAKEDVTDREIYTALSRVNLDDFIKENGGLDRCISEDATNLSGGQKQRLALAVNLVASKDIYVFDEATSNIDIESEEIIMNTIRELSKSKSVVIISHRLANIVDADQIYYLEQGEVRECGNHADLMGQKGGYSRLYLTQKELEKGFTDEPCKSPEHKKLKNRDGSRMPEAETVNMNFL